MELKTEGIVLKRYKKGENDDITVIFTRVKGKVLVSSKSTRKMGSKLKPTLELFSLNDYQLEKKKKDSQFYVLVQSKPLKMFENMRISLRKIGFSYLVVELLNKFLQLEDAHEELYDLTKNVLHSVDSGEYANIENVESYFKLKLLEMSGFDITEDDSYMKSRGAGVEMPKILEMIASSGSPEKLEIEYARIREINKLIDSYIINILGEDINSAKFLQGLKIE